MWFATWSWSFLTPTTAGTPAAPVWSISITIPTPVAAAWAPNTIPVSISFSLLHAFSLTIFTFPLSFTVSTAHLLSFLLFATFNSFLKQNILYDNNSQQHSISHSLSKCSVLVDVMRYKHNLNLNKEQKCLKPTEIIRVVPCILPYCSKTWSTSKIFGLNNEVMN